MCLKIDPCRFIFHTKTQIFLKWVESPKTIEWSLKSKHSLTFFYMFLRKLKFCTIYETSHQSRFDAWYWMLGAGALGRPRGIVRGERWEEGSGWGTHVYLCSGIVNQYNIVKLKKKIKTTTTTTTTNKVCQILRSIRMVLSWLLIKVNSDSIPSLILTKP